MDKKTENKQLKNTDALFGISEEIKTFDSAFKFEQAGIVISSGGGVMKIKGLKNAKYGELLDIEGRGSAIVLSLEEDSIGAIELNEENIASSGMIVKTTGKVVEIPVGNQLLGRVVNPLGLPLDGLGKITAKKTRPLESKAPDIINRDKVNEPLYTGLLAIDSMIPIGKGQRELIIGDRQTGKTTIAVDTIINQRGKDVICIYVAIGQKSSNVSSIVHTLNESHAMEYTVIVCSTAKDSAPMQYIAPFAGCAIAEEFMYAGKDVLIIYDDLSKHAVAYRSMSLLLRRPPGREAYPGDIFYLHSRLLERSAKLKKSLGGGSMTALPIIETQAGDISAYIPTNVISITDGQIYLESELFYSGIRPAVNVGLSVSRVGSAAQVNAMRKIGGKLRLDLSQYRELAVFAGFGSELDAASKARLEQGKRVTECLKQNARSSMDITHQIIILHVLTKEMLSQVAVKDIRSFNRGFLYFVEADCPDVVENIRKTGNISKDDNARLENALKNFFTYYYTTGK